MSVSSEEQSMQSDKPKVLVVDDDPAMTEYVREALRQQGFDVVVAGSGEQALRMVARDVVNLIIIDILMPGKDGLETIMELRRRQNAAKVIAMSGGGSFHLANALMWAEQLGAQRTLRKPFTPQELIATVRETLGLTTT
jgi:DNA-binding response OmpR family regulator